MKIFIIIVSILILLQCAQELEGRHTKKVRRSLDIIDTIKNKTRSVINYVKKTEQSIENFAKNTTHKTISLIRRGKEYIFNKAENGTTKWKKTFSNYIKKAQVTGKTIYDSIGPEQVDYECSDDDPANQMTATELITLHGYFVETHTVLTDDGYLLTLHRIPYYGVSRKAIANKTILLHHGLLGSSIDWVIPGNKRSLAYILVDAGYDVWMANVRGNTYSRAHISLKSDSHAFWNFSFHEVGYYDLPAVIDYIIDLKGDVEINYVGFSMGTTVLFTLLSTRPKYNDVLKAGFALAPVAYMSDIKSPFKVLSEFGSSIEYFMKLFGANEFMPRNALVRYLSKHSCKLTDVEDALCEISIFVLCGLDKNHFDRSLLPMIMGHVPAGASTKTLAHFSQEIHNGGEFQQFDYGAEENMKIYGKSTPPKYPVDKITLPIALLNGQDDWLSSMNDVIRLYNQLINPMEHYIVPDKKFNHLDFLFARDAPTLVYDKLLSLLEGSNSIPEVFSNNVES